MILDTSGCKLHINAAIFQTLFFYPEVENLCVCSACTGKFSTVAKSESVGGLLKKIDLYLTRQKEQLNSCLHVLFGQV